MKILHVISNLSPSSGGPTTVVRSLSACQVKSGLNVTVCTTNWDRPSCKYNREEKNPFELGIIYKFFPFFSLMLISPVMGKWFRDNIKLFDIVHIHCLYRFPVSFAAWYARKADVPYLISPHGGLDPYLYGQSRYNVFLKRIYERLFDFPNLNHSSAIHYTTEEEKKRAEFIGLKSKPVIVPNGIDWENYKFLPPKGKFRRRLNLDSHKPLVLFLGRINFKKGLDLLVPSFHYVAKLHPDARLAIVGPDNEGYGSKVRRWCQEQGIQDKVYFVDCLGFHKVKEAYVDADLFVLPSYTENFGLTVVEAMACGCPVVISDQVNIWREIQNASAGIIVSLDPLSIADAISRLITDRVEATIMGRRGRFTAKKCYAWPRIVKQLTNVYSDLIEEKLIHKHLLKQ
jgi:glycosyltransferase involved in cell wall biosynthesis